MADPVVPGTTVPSAATAPASRGRGLLRLAILVALFVGVALAARALGFGRYTDLATLAETVRSLRGRPGIVPGFVVAYAVAASVGLPATPFTLAGGALFGVGLGSLLNWIGATLGATGSYFLARLLGHGALGDWIRGRAPRLDALLDQHGFSTLLRLRLIPVMPFNGLNLAAGLAGIRPLPYIAATAIGILPGTVVFTSFADALLAGAAGARREALIRAAIAGGLLLLLSFLPTLARRAGWMGRGAATMLLVLLAVSGTAARADAQVPRAGPGSRADSAGPRTATFDHSVFDGLLRRHVVDGMVDYEAFARAPEMRRYLDQLARADVAALSRPEQLALWINAYNAYTIHLVNKHGEKESIRNINKSLGFLKLKGPWGESMAKVGGKTYTLDDIEHGIIRKRFSEPRIHFALVCAAMGCPPLRSEAYTGPRLEAQLQEQGVRFLRQTPAKNRVEVARRVVLASLVLVYYDEDFGGKPKGVGRYLARWYPEGSAERRLLESGDFELVQSDYDWSLNSQANARRRR